MTGLTCFNSFQQENMKKIVYMKNQMKKSKQQSKKNKIIRLYDIIVTVVYTVKRIMSIIMNRTYNEHTCDRLFLTGVHVMIGGSEIFIH